MTDDDRPVPDDELAALLRRVGDDPTLEPSNRDRARAAMFAEFDAIVGDTDTVESTSGHTGELLSLVPDIEADDGQQRHDRRRRSFASAGLAIAAACVIVFALVSIANVRDTPDESDATSSTLPSPDASAVPLSTPSAAAPSPLLAGASYRTDEILDGVSFSGLGGLELVALRPGLVVMDSVSESGAISGRISIFEAEEQAVSDVIDTSVENGRLQVESLQFVVGGQLLPREDLSVTPDGIVDLQCTGALPCLPLVAPNDDLGPHAWAGAENFLVEVRSGEPSVYVLVQGVGFPNPALSQGTEIIESLRFD